MRLFVGTEKQTEDLVEVFAFTLALTSITLYLSINQLENLCIEIRKPRSKPFLAATWYRPPDASVELFTYFESLIGKIDAENIEFYLMGDLNCNLAALQLDNNANTLTSIAVYRLQQLITDPTRCTESSSTLIDLMFTNCPERVVCSGVSHISISDHSLVYLFHKLSIDQPSRGHTTITYRKFTNFNSPSFREDISQQSWDNILNYNDINAIWRQGLTPPSLLPPSQRLQKRRYLQPSTPLQTHHHQ